MVTFLFYNGGYLLSTRILNYMISLFHSGIVIVECARIYFVVEGTYTLASAPTKDEGFFVI